MHECPLKFLEMALQIVRLLKTPLSFKIGASNSSLLDLR